MTQGLDEKEAVKKAVSRVTDNFYMRPLDGLQLPKYVTDNGEIHRLNPEFVRDRLLKLRAQLVNGKIDYDSIHTFGQNSQNSPRKITNALASGKWIVTEDGKSLHFTYLTDAGQLQAVMLDSHNPFSVNLLEINTPESEEERLQWFEELKKHLYEQPNF